MLRMTRFIVQLLTIFGLASSAIAQCPPGMRLAAPGASYQCIPDTQQLPNYPIWSRQDPLEGVVGMANPMLARVDAMTALFELQALDLKRAQAALDANPKLKELSKGKWEYFQIGNKSRPGEGCAALYTNLKGGIMLTDESKNGPPDAMMTFLGMTIPRPAQLDKIQITFDQKDGKPQTVKAFNFTAPGGKLGAISIGVPTMQLLVESMEEKQFFDIAIGGKSVFNTEWLHGLEARKELMGCLTAKR